MTNTARQLIINFVLAFLSIFAPYLQASEPHKVETAASNPNVKLKAETLNYKVLFKWGLIHKVAGSANVILTPGRDTYKAVVTARSASWADRFYSLRDTLTSEINRSNLTPRSYERIAHEDGKYVRDYLTFTSSGDHFKASCERTRLGKNDKTPTVTTTALEATGMTTDFLSAFYYLRSLDFASMTPGNSVTINVFSGKRKELLRFTYRGEEDLKIDGSNHRVYRVTFTFTSDGKKETSDAITAWISTDSNRIPLQIEGKLKVGKIRCCLEKP